MQSRTLPSPDNLRRWNKASGIQCGLCGRPNVTLNHILASCAWVRDREDCMSREDRFTWRHNCLIREVVKGIEDFLLEINASAPSGPVPSRKESSNLSNLRLATVVSSCSRLTRICMYDWVIKSVRNYIFWKG